MKNFDTHVSETVITVAVVLGFFGLITIISYFAQVN